ncbi:hypothetical protein Tco_0302291 [Tanacetum coccineum]
MKLLRHLWNGNRRTHSFLNGIRLARDVMIKILLLHQVLISTKRNDMTLALQAHHSPQLHSHLLGRRLTLEKLLQATVSSSFRTTSRRHTNARYYANIFDSEDTDSAHLLKIKPRPEWLKLIPEEDRPATPELAWVIHTSHIPNAVNNWANALASTFQASTENSLLEKTRDMRTFIN